MQSSKNSSTSKLLLTTDYTAGLNYEKSINLTVLLKPAILTIYRAYSDVKPPTTLGADTPGIHLLLIESTSNETKIVSHFAYKSAISLAKTCPPCVLHLFSGSNLCLLIDFYIQYISQFLDCKYSQ
jgi:hypothetical protein